MAQVRPIVSRTAAERPDAAENQEPHPAPPTMHLLCGVWLWSEQGSDRLMRVLLGESARAVFLQAA